MAGARLRREGCRCRVAPSIILRAPPQIRTRPFRASGSSDLRFRYTVGVNDSSWWKVEVPVEYRAHVIWALPRDRRLSHLCQVGSTLCRTLAMERLFPMIP